MFRIARVLPGLGAAILVFASGIQASALGAGFQATLEPDCVVPGQQVHLTIPDLGAGTGAVVSVNLSYADSAAGGGAQSATGYANAQNVFTANFTIPTTAIAGNAQVAIYVASTVGGIDNAESGVGTIRIATGLAACPSPGVAIINGTHFTGAVSYSVKKTCDSGVSGNAVFSVSATLGELGRFAFPSITVPCNGAAVVLPAFPIHATTLTLHEASAPAGGVAATDWSATLPPAGGNPITIHDAQASSAATPAPTPKVRVLAGTGGGKATGSPWIALLASGALLAGVVGWLHHRTNFRQLR